jgi:predicted Zn finger-like uncharacterized protein
MIVTCEQCHTQFRLDPALIGVLGRKVKCAQCKHVWTQLPEKREQSAADDAFGSALPYEAPAVIAPPPDEPQPPATIADPMLESFDDILKQTAAAIAPAPKIPESVIPAPPGSTPAQKGPVYRVMGMEAGQFGMLTFLLCCFATLIPLLLARGPLTHAWPPLSLLYKSVGIRTAVPGEGLKLSGLSAENRVEKAGRVLAVEGQLSNMTEQVIPYPALRLTLTSAYGAVLKTWTLDNKDAKPLAPGEAAPVKLELKDVPEGGTDVELKVVDR